jgi:hypothetical protein
VAPLQYGPLFEQSRARLVSGIMWVIEVQCFWSWRLTITPHIKHESMVARLILLVRGLRPPGVKGSGQVAI